MAVPPSLSPEEELATAFGLWSDADMAIEAAVNEGLLQIRNSRDVALARADVLLQAAQAAAEQVQDIRIDLLANPEANYTSFLVDVLVTIAFETTIAGALLSRISKALFSSLMASTAMRMRRGLRDKRGAINRIRDALKAKQLLRDLPRMRAADRRNAVRELTGQAANRESKARRLLEELIARQPAAAPSASNMRPALKSFHEAVRAMARGGGDIEENLSGAAQTAIALTRGDSAPPGLDAADSPGVRLLTDIQAYSSRLRLTIQLVHNQLEKWMRDQLLEPDGDAFREILEVCTYRDIRADGDGDIRRIDDDLTALRNRYRLLFEAVIWAFLFGFRRPSSAREPMRVEIVDNEFKGLDARLSDYWFARFGAQVDARNAGESAYSYAGSFKDLSRRAKLEKLRDYFWAIMDMVHDLETMYLREPTKVVLGTWY